MSSGRPTDDRTGPAAARVSIFRRVLTAQRLARTGTNGRENGNADADVDADEVPTARESAAFAAAQESATAMNAAVEPETAAMQAAEGRETVETLRADLDAARELARSSTERLTVLERDLAAAITELSRVPAILEEAERLRTVDRDVEALRARVSEAEEQRAVATSRAAAAETRAKSAELRALRADEVGKAVQARIDSAQAQAMAAEARVAAVDRRATSAEDRVADLEASQRDAERRHAEELTEARSQNRPPESDAGELARLVAEVESLRSRVAVAEEAVAAALRELGVEPSDGPLTVADVVRAVGPLTLHALGEGTPGWAPHAPEDTLAAAVLTLAQKAAEQQRRLDRLGSALSNAGGRR